MRTIGKINTRESTKKELLEQYFLNSERHFKIGSGKIEVDEKYEDKVTEMNLCNRNCRAISKAMGE